MALQTVNLSAGERKVDRISLDRIVVSHNPRNPIRSLSSHLDEETTPLSLIHDMALSDDMDQVSKFVEMMETHEQATTDDDPEEKRHGIVALALSRIKEEIQPVVVRPFSRKNAETGEHETFYGMIAGERRVLAAAYAWAKKRLGDENFSKAKPSVGAIVRRMTVDDAFELAVEENAQRLDMTPLEYGEIFHQYREKVNPDTGKKYNLQQIAKKLDLDYQFVRRREALVFLSDKDKERLNEGKIGLSKAIEIGLQLKSGKKADEIEEKKNVRHKALTLKQLQVVFDKSREESEDFLRGLAIAMQIELDVAISESDRRLNEVEENDINPSE